MKYLDNRKIRFDIVTAFVCLMSITVASLLSLSIYENDRSILSFSEQYARNISLSMSNEIDRYFDDVEGASFVAASYLDEKKDVANDPTLNLLFLETTKNNAQIFSIYIATDNGKFFQARNIDPQTPEQLKPHVLLAPEITFGIRTLDRVNGKTDEKWSYLDKNYTELLQETITNSNYAPFTRDWYTTPLNQGKKLWSEVYIFKTSKMPGLTFSFPLKKKSQNGFYGALGTDVTIDSLSSFLKQRKISDNSTIYLLNGNNQIISSSENKSFVKQEGDQLSLLSIDKLEDQLPNKAMQAIVKTKKEYNLFEYEGKDYMSFFRTFREDSSNFKIVIIAPTNDFVEIFRNTQRKILFVSLFIFAFSIMVFYWIAKRISKPLTQLGQQAETIKRLEFKEIVPIQSNIIEIQLLSNAVQSMNKSINMFAKYVPKGLVSKLFQKEEAATLGGSIQELTMMFTDIEGFTSISEKMPAEDLMLYVSEYFDELTKLIMDNEGTIDKYIGDSIMAIWGAPTADPQHTIHACFAALACQRKLDLLNKKWTSLGKPPLITRMGINCGEVIVGNMGSQDRMSYTVIGDNVNLASRLEGINKLYHTNTLVSENVVRKVQDYFYFRVLDKVSVKGKDRAIKIYELVDYVDIERDLEKSRAYCTGADAAFSAYLRQDWDEAIQLYTKFNEEFDDYTARKIIERCEEFKVNPPAPEWNGSTRLTEK